MAWQGVNISSFLGLGLASKAIQLLAMGFPLGTIFLGTPYKTPASKLRPSDSNFTLMVPQAYVSWQPENLGDVGEKMKDNKDSGLVFYWLKKRSGHSRWEVSFSNMQVPNMLLQSATTVHEVWERQSNSSQRAMGNHSGIKHRPVWTFKHGLCQSICSIPCLLLAMHWLWHQFIFLIIWMGSLQGKKTILYCWSQFSLYLQKSTSTFDGSEILQQLRLVVFFHYKLWAPSQLVVWNVFHQPWQY